jgi:cytochrome c oxidase subunit 3
MSAHGGCEAIVPEGAATLAGSPERAPPGTGALGMWIFIASEILFFGGLFFAYLYGRSHWTAGFATASRHTDVVLGTLNTGLLLTSSALAALAHACAERGERAWVARLLAATAGLGLAFLAVKGFEYRDEWHEHLFPGPDFALAGVPGAEEFFVLYFIMTGIHAIHLGIGIAVMGVFAAAARRRVPGAVDPGRVEVAALYWHFVDVIWIFLYPLIYLVQRT